MKTKPVLILFLIVILIAGFFYWQSAYQQKIDKSGALHKILAAPFLKFGLTDNNLVKKTTEENTLYKTRYISSYVEYDVGSSFTWKSFEASLRSALKNTGFRIYDIEQSFKRNLQSYTIIIHFGKYDVLAIKINRKGVVKPEPAVKIYKRPRVAIILDDFGYNMRDLDILFNIKQPITLAILPNEMYSINVANMAKSRGFEIILHLPLEPHPSPGVVEEVTTIRTGMSEKEVLLHLKKEIASVPGIDGVNNHMGSKATEDIGLMTIILKYLKANNLYFLDSLTSQKSVCRAAAQSLGMWYGKRDMFLDNSNVTAAIEKQVMDMKDLAFKRGTVIAIGHDRKNTIAVLARMMPELAAEGIDFVRLSELVKQ